jgi:hypothetical protein
MMSTLKYLHVPHFLMPLVILAAFLMMSAQTAPPPATNDVPVKPAIKTVTAKNDAAVKPPAKPAPPVVKLLEMPLPLQTSVFPAGGRRGATVPATATGTDLGRRNRGLD